MNGFYCIEIKIRLHYQLIKVGKMHGLVPIRFPRSLRLDANSQFILIKIWYTTQSEAIERPQKFRLICCQFK